MALTAAFALQPMLVALGMHAGAAEVLSRAGQVAESLPGDRGRLALAQVALERARATHQAGRAQDARSQLRALLDGLEDEHWEGADVMLRLVVDSLGHAAFSTGDFAEAARHFERALAMDWPDLPEHDAERAELEWHLATAMVQLGRAPEARAVYARAFERGRASGLSAGRYASAQSAFQLAEQGDLTAQQKEWFTASLSLARLCGTPAGDQLSQRAGERLAELAGGA
jgi:tetratricopeptide (TPR) repeat protein